MFRAKVVRDREHPGDWRVERLGDDGEAIEVAIFSGGDERQRALRYADREYGEFDEIELEPYQRSPLADIASVQVIGPDLIRCARLSNSRCGIW